MKEKDLEAQKKSYDEHVETHRKLVESKDLEIELLNKNTERLMLEVEQLNKTIEKDKKTTEELKQELVDKKDKLVTEVGLEMADDYTKKKRMELK